MDKDWKEEVLHRIELLEAAAFYKEVGDLPESRFQDLKEPKTRIPNIKKVREYIKDNEVSKTELVILCSKFGIKASSILPKDDILDLLLKEATGSHEAELYFEDDPLQKIRDDTEAFIKENNIALSTMKCDLRCQSCPEGRVILCQLHNKETINNYFENK